ncbi:MAG: hypothetical protein ACKO2G_16460 [Verrucomicrobiales bacterium]
MKRPFHEKIMDRVWCEVTAVLDHKQVPPIEQNEYPAASISAAMDWPAACSALAAGRWSSKNFRRSRFVRQVVETLGPSDGLHFANWIANVRPDALENPLARRANDWGNPIQVPAWVLGTSKPWSPTSLRYLAHAIWLEKNGFTTRGGKVIEIGVGFGGLSAMLAAITGIFSVHVDLPAVRKAAAIQMAELGLGGNLSDSPKSDAQYCFVSNYALTEMNRDLQNDYIRDFARLADKGLILSNAGHFSGSIGGRTDEELLGELRKAGLDAKLVRESPLLGPSDKLCANCLIQWESKICDAE